MRQEELFEKIRTTYQSFNSERIILFGSWAKGKGDDYSDIDLIFVLNSQKRFLDRLEELYERWPLPKGVDILAYTPQEFEEMLEEGNSFLERAVQEGIVIYEKSSH